MGAPAAIGIHDNLATGQTGITLWATDDEASGRLDLRYLRQYGGNKI